MKRHRGTQCILLSKRSHSEKAPYCMTPNACGYRKGKTMETQSKLTGEFSQQGSYSVYYNGGYMCQKA